MAKLNQRTFTLAGLTTDAMRKGLKVKESCKLLLADGRTVKLTVKGAPADGCVSLAALATALVNGYASEPSISGDLSEGGRVSDRKRSIAVDPLTLAGMVDADAADSAIKAMAEYQAQVQSEKDEAAAEENGTKLRPQVKAAIEQAEKDASAAAELAQEVKEHAETQAKLAKNGQKSGK